MSDVDAVITLALVVTAYLVGIMAERWDHKRFHLCREKEISPWKMN
jgi:hypothetical protein